MKFSLLKGLSANVVGGLMPMVVTLVVTPFYIQMIGLERFGVLSLVWLLLGYLGIFDLGFGRAVTSSIAKNLDEVRRSEVVWTALSLSAASGVVGAAVALSIGWFFFGNIFHVSGEIGGEVVSALPLLAALLPMATASSVLTGYLQGRQEFTKLNIAQTLGMILFQVAPLAAAKVLSIELIYLAAGAFLGRLMGFLVLALYCWLSSPEVRTPRFRKSDVRQMMSFGGWVMLSGVLSQIMLTMDRVIIGAVMNLSAVAVYSLPYNIIIRATLIPYSWFSVLFPRFAAADNSEAERLLGWASRVLVLAVTPAAIAGILIMRPFLDIWIGKDVGGQAAPAGIILMAGFWFYALTFMPLAFFQARNRPRIPVISYAVEFVLFVPLLYISITKAGLIGASIAWVLRVVVDALFLYGMARQLRSFLLSIAIGLPWLASALWWEFFAVEFQYYYLGKAIIILLCLLSIIPFIRSEYRNSFKPIDGNADPLKLSRSAEL